MHLEAHPMRLIAVTDGVLAGEEHILLFLDQSGGQDLRGFALNLEDARALLIALDNILPQARRIQADLHQRN
jgi:hypothetical protein